MKRKVLQEKEKGREGSKVRSVCLSGIRAVPGGEEKGGGGRGCPQ